ncbi:MAG: ABC transporter permease [Myxococcota bacterium]
MTRFVRQCLAVAHRDAAVHRSYGWTAWLGLGTAALGLLSYFFIGKLVSPQTTLLPGGDYFAFVWLGVTLQLWVTATLSGLGHGLARQAAEGTLESSLAAGASPLALVFGPALVPSAFALVQAVITLGLGLGVFGLHLEASGWALAGFAIVATLVACAPIGIVGACAWLVTRRSGWVISATLLGFSVFGGVYFPVALLPEPWSEVARWVPIQAGLEAARGALLEGASWTSSQTALLRLALLSLAGLPLSLACFRWALRRAERRGDLALA